jgi:hypothetical protein
MQISSDELLDIFDRHIAPHSMIGINEAARLIAEWENDVVTQRQIATTPLSTPASASSVTDLDVLRRILGGAPSEEQP